MHYYSCSERFNFAWAGSLLCDFIPTVATSLCSEKYSLVLDYALLLALQLSYRSWIVAPIALEAVLADNRRNRRQYFSSSFLTTSTVVFFFDLARPRPTSLDLARPRWTSLDLARPRSTPPDLDLNYYSGLPQICSYYFRPVFPSRELLKYFPKC